MCTWCLVRPVINDHCRPVTPSDGHRLILVLTPRPSSCSEPRTTAPNEGPAPNPPQGPGIASIAHRVSGPQGPDIPTPSGGFSACTTSTTHDHRVRVRLGIVSSLLGYPAPVLRAQL